MSTPANSSLPEHPPRVVERTVPLRATRWSRILSGGLAMACMAVLTMSAWMQPSTEGHGTHTQLGLKPCMWAVTLDKPCMTCGMTTSFAHAGEGNWLGAFLTQPMGSLLVILTSVVFWAAAVQSISGARIGTMMQPALRPRVFIALGIALLLAWGYKLITW